MRANGRKLQLRQHAVDGGGVAAPAPPAAASHADPSEQPADAVKTEFSRDRDQHQVAQLLQAGCTHTMQALDIENFSLDDLIVTAMDDPPAIGGGSNAFRRINFADLRTAYRLFLQE
jgi:hypothetical protein